jgi:hypothetical protein
VDASRPFGTILWGGVGADGRLLSDGVMIDASGESRLLPQAPICARRDFAMARGADEQVVIWGGVDQTGTPLADGAAYSLRDGTWQRVEPGPLPGGPAMIAGNLAVVADPETGLPMAALLRPTDESGQVWRGPYEVPLPRGERYAVAGCCVGEEAIVYSVQSDGTAEAIRSVGLYGGGAVGWEPLGRVPFPVTPGVHPTAAHAQEEDLLAWIADAPASADGAQTDGPAAIVVQADRPEAAWRVTDPTPAGVVGDPSLVLSPTHLISIKGMAAYDLVADQWLRLPRRDQRPRFGTPDGATAWWQDGRLFVFGGRAPDGSMDRLLWTFQPRLAKGTVDLPTRPRGVNNGCVVPSGRGTWRLTGDRNDPMVAWAASGGRRIAQWWPDGWVARFGRDLEVLDTRGRVRAREGDVCDVAADSGG